MTGLVHYMALGCPPVQPVAMIGGALWATGNLMCPLIIDCIGLGLGLLIWGSANMVVGWSSAHFGILGVKQQFVSHPAMNCIGAAIAVVAIMVYSQVKPMGNEERANRKKAGKYQIPINAGDVYEDMANMIDKTDDVEDDDGKLTAGWSMATRRVVGCLLAVVAGSLFGACFNPAQGVQDYSETNYCSKINYTHAKNVLATADLGFGPSMGSAKNTSALVMAEQDCNNIVVNCKQLDLARYNMTADERTTMCDNLGGEKGKVYCTWDGGSESCQGIPIEHMAFSQFCGILLSSFIYYVLYNIYFQWYKGINPWVNIPLIGPGFASGMIWAAAQIGWFYANENLDMAIAFPIVATAPGIIGTLWGIFLYSEVSLKTSNIAMLVAAMVMAACSDTIITLSK